MPPICSDRKFVFGLHMWQVKCIKNITSNPGHSTVVVGQWGLSFSLSLCCLFQLFWKDVSHFSYLSSPTRKQYQNWVYFGSVINMLCLKCIGWHEIALISQQEKPWFTQDSSPVFASWRTESPITLLELCFFVDVVHIICESKRLVQHGPQVPRRAHLLYHIGSNKSFDRLLLLPIDTSLLFWLGWVRDGCPQTIFWGFLKYIFNDSTLLRCATKAVSSAAH